MSRREIGSAVETLPSGGAGGLILLLRFAYPLTARQGNLLRIESLNKLLTAGGFFGSRAQGKDAFSPHVRRASSKSHSCRKMWYDCPTADAFAREFERMRRDVETAIERSGRAYRLRLFEKEVANSAAEASLAGGRIAPARCSTVA